MTNFVMMTKPTSSSFLCHVSNKINGLRMTMITRLGINGVLNEMLADRHAMPEGR